MRRSNDNVKCTVRLVQPGHLLRHVATLTSVTYSLWSPGVCPVCQLYLGASCILPCPWISPLQAFRVFLVIVRHATAGGVFAYKSKVTSGSNCVYVYAQRTRVIAQRCQILDSDWPRRCGLIFRNISSDRGSDGKVNVNALILTLYSATRTWIRKWTRSEVFLEDMFVCRLGKESPVSPASP